MAVDVKICGLTTKEAVKAAVLNKASMIGFHFISKSEYCITPQYAGLISKDAPPFITRVAVIDKFDKSEMEEIIEALAPKYIQHPQNVDADNIRKHFDLRLICDLTNRQPLESIDKYDYYLINISDLHEYQNIEQSKIIITGNISRYNVKNILSQTNVKFISVTDSLGLSPGILDPKLIDDFFTSLKQLSYL